MACINMLNPEHRSPPPPPPPPLSPRISFSNDFIVENPPPPSAPPRHAASDINFEFSAVGNRPMMAADELFFKGRMLPLRAPTTTLRDELRAQGDDDDDNYRPLRVSSLRWKELFGLKKQANSVSEVVHSSTSTKTVQELKIDVEMIS